MVLKDLLSPSIFEAIDRAGISTTKQLIMLSVWDIKKYTNLSIDDICMVKNIVTESVCPSIITCNRLSEVQREVSTGCGAINDLLKGGLRRGTITEIYGESGCGKTQLALQIALNNWSEGSFYVCTEDLFPTKRFEELKRALPSFDYTIDYGKNVFVEHITEATDLMSCINVRLPKLLKQKNLSVVIIDSIAAPFRCETTNYIKRAEELREIAFILTRIAQKHNLAVLCINQVTACFDDFTDALPSLGLAWSNMVTIRLLVTKTNRLVDAELKKPADQHSYIRELSVLFAPHLPKSVIEFVITKSSIKALKPAKKL